MVFHKLCHILLGEVFSRLHWLRRSSAHFTLLHWLRRLV
jgi:hypothetical protein